MQKVYLRSTTVGAEAGAAGNVWHEADISLLCPGGHVPLHGQLYTATDDRRTRVLHALLCAETGPPWGNRIHGYFLDASKSLGRTSHDCSSMSSSPLNQISDTMDGDKPYSAPWSLAEETMRTFLPSAPPMICQQLFST